MRLNRHSNLGPILHHLGDIVAFCAPDPTLIPPLFWGYFGRSHAQPVTAGCSRLHQIAMLGSMWAETLSYSAVKLFSKYSDICDHGT